MLASDDALQFDRRPLGSAALATKSSVMSAVGNHYGYDRVVSLELEALAGGRLQDLSESARINECHILLRYIACDLV